MVISYRQAQKEAVDELCRLSADVIRRYEDFSRINREKALGWTHLSIAENIDAFSVILADGHKAGYLFITPVNGVYEIRDLLVFPQWQNKGIGTAVINQCVKDTGGNVRVYVFTGDLQTYSLFESCGFHPVQVFHRTRYLMAYGEQNNVMAEDTFDE